MKCIFCGCEESKVIDSRSTEELNSIRRRRECLKCGKRFTTYETIETAPLLIIKKDGTRQPYNKEKLQNSIIKATENRPISINQIDEMVAFIEKKINKNLSEIYSSEICNIVLSLLKNSDEISFARYAVRYKDFQSIPEIIDFLQNN